MSITFGRPVCSREPLRMQAAALHTVPPQQHRLCCLHRSGAFTNLRHQRACLQKRRFQAAKTFAQSGQQQQQDITRRVAVPAAASILIGAAGFVYLRNLFSDLAGPEGKKATLKALSGEEEAREGKVSHTDEEWHKLLTPAAYRILRQAGTELPFSSPLEKAYLGVGCEPRVKEKRKGTFICAGCGAAVYRSETKFDSGTGWPSFYQAVDGGIKRTRDESIRFLPRTEVRCAQCEGHLGHVFNDGPPPTGLRYCMNGAAMDFRLDSA